MKTRKSLFIFLCTAMMVLTFSMPSMAANLAKAWSITPVIGGYSFGDDENLDTSVLYGLRVGYNLTKEWTLEGVFTYADADGDDPLYYRGTPYDDDAEMMGYRVEALYNFLPDTDVVLFVAAGLGGRSLDYDYGDDNDEFVVDYGLGFKWFFLDNVALRGDARHIYVTDESENNFEYTIGLSFFFGGEKPKAELPPPPPPKPAPVAAPELDTDGDGVIDRLDQCPDTPAGVSVDEVGCPLDTDKDGVYDYLDKCPDTPIELKVDKDGCPIKVTVNLNVLFDFDKAVVKPQYRDEIKRLADYLIKYPWEKGTLEGHTCSIGTEAYNQKLSQRRVDAIKAYLVEEFGIAEDRLQAVGYGESKPIASNDTREGRELNRRVQAVMETYIRK
ncbi:MAG: outer membrane beta-barrel domain-containing protein [Syntrophaceae bacterium]|nr:outer membrane beta-barrel domain-containing protein [Syntrophaceae bacterium]